MVIDLVDAERYSCRFKTPAIRRNQLENYIIYDTVEINEIRILANLNNIISLVINGDEIVAVIRCAICVVFQISLFGIPKMKIEIVNMYEY